MTKEEKIAELINIRDNFNYTLTPKEVFDDAIRLLEQEPIIDEIMAEINTPNRGSCDYYIVDRIEEIINKYKGEEA